MRKIILSLIVLSILSTMVIAPVTVDNLFLCDRGTENLLDRATLCQGGSIYGVVLSTALLKSINGKPIMQDTVGGDKLVEGITFIYDAPVSGNQKQVKAIFTKTLGNSPIPFPLDTFSSNVVQGQGLMLIYQEEYYLLQNLQATAGTALFDTSQLKLKHIPTGKEYTANLYTGTEQYYFEVLGGERITIQVSGTQVIISTAAPGEAPSSYVVPYDLTREYEVPFTKDAPVRIISPDLGAFTICRNDDARDTQLVQVCLENDPSFTLPVDVLTKRTITTDGNGVDNGYAFLFEVDKTTTPATKKVSLFTITPLSSASTALSYSNFLDALADGRRAVFEFERNLYLMEHPAGNTFLLASITLRGAQPGSTITAPSPNENLMEYPIANGGRLYLQRFYGDPPPPFQINALKNEELQPVDLQKELSVTLTSDGTRILSSNDVTNGADLTFGTVSTRRSGLDPDVLYSDQTFKLSTNPGGIPTNLNLDLRVPIENGNGKVLFYYKQNNFELGRTFPTKTALAYRLYTLQPDQFPAPSHPYTDFFIGNITTGKELALEFVNSTGGSAYYILGYQGAVTDRRVVFGVNQLTLRRIDQASGVMKTQEGRATVFTVPEGKIIVEVDENPPAKISFRSTTTLALATTVFPTEDYSVILDKSHRIKLWENGPVATLCDQGYESTPVAAVCIDYAGGTQSELFIDGADILTLQESSSSDPSLSHSYLLEANGQTKQYKEVTIHRILEPTSQTDSRDPTGQTFSNIISLSDWAAFIQHLARNPSDLPIFNLSSSKPEGTLYIPANDEDSLKDFKLKKYGSNSALSLRGWKELSPITGEGSFVLDNRVLSVTQTVVGTGATRKVKTDFILEPFYFLPENGDRLILNSTLQPDTLSFITAINGLKYELTANALEASDDGFLVDLSLTNAFQRYFGQRDIKRFPLNGITAELEVINLTEDRQQISIKRLR